jgi:hypothetical protein
MNVENGAEAALFPEMEYINGIAVAVQRHTYCTYRYMFLLQSLVFQIHGLKNYIDDKALLQLFDSVSSLSAIVCKHGRSDSTLWGGWWCVDNEMVRFHILNKD